MKKNHSIIGVTLGDPAGIGPQVAINAASELQQRKLDWCILLAGPKEVAEDTIRRYKINIKIKQVQQPEEAINVYNALPFLDIPMKAPFYFEKGIANPYCAEIASETVKKLVQLSNDKRIQAVACAPINKEALLMAKDLNCTDHTQYIAKICGSKNYGMYFFSSKFAAMTVTGHITHKNVTAQITSDAISKKLQLADKTYYELNNSKPKIAVCSLDPHCGENGYLGNIDKDIVKTAISNVNEKGISAEGPISADAVFRHYILKDYDLVLGMYHDQVKVAIAALNNDIFVSYLAGVSVIRTTTTHGTAFDIARSGGSADHTNMRHTIEWAMRIAKIYKASNAGVKGEVK